MIKSITKEEFEKVRACAHTKIPKNKMIVDEFLASGSDFAEVVITDNRNPKHVVSGIHNVLYRRDVINKYKDVRVMLRKNKVYLYKCKEK